MKKKTSIEHPLDAKIVGSNSTIDQMADVHPDDISKNLFVLALRRAVDACGGVLWDLARRVKVHGRCMENWAKGRVPPYFRMQEFYRKFLDVAKGDEK